MASGVKAELDGYYDSVLSHDTRTRTQVHGGLVEFLRNPVCNMECRSLSNFVDGLGSWVDSSNYKISINGMEVLSLIIDRIGDKFGVHVTNVIGPVMSRLGDMKDDVRSAALELLLKLMLPASSPSFVFEKISAGFSHKQFRVREGICLCLQSILNRYGAKSLQLSKIVPHIVKLLDDQNTQVRESAMGSLVEIYRHVGERVKVDLQKKGIPQTKLTTLFSRMEEVKLSGDMVSTATLSTATPTHYNDHTDSSSATSKPPVFRAPSGVPRKNNTQAKSAKAGGKSGAVDMDSFTGQFESVPHVQVFSGRDVESHLASVQEALANTNLGWEKCITALKKVRSVVLAGGCDYDEFLQGLRLLEVVFQNMAKDLRSQIVRECCITISYLAQTLGLRMEKFSEALLPTLMTMIPNSARVMATSAITACRFIISNVHSPKLLPIIASQLAAKSNSIRREAGSFLEDILLNWPVHPLEKHIAILQEAIRKGIVDADAETRAISRKAFWAFSNHFKDQADRLYGSLEPSRQKQLQGELSNSSSASSLVTAVSAGPSTGYRGVSAGPHRAGLGSLRAPSQERDMMDSAGPRRATVQRKSSQRSQTAHNGTSASSEQTYSKKGGVGSSSGGVSRALQSPIRSPSGIPRSSSATDLQLKTSKLPRLGVNALGGISRTRLPSGSQRDDRSGAGTKMGVSQSQPGSRSNSPSSRLFMSSGIAVSGRRRKSGIPRSQGASRETSPSRSAYGGSGRERRLSGSTASPAQRIPHVRTSSQGTPTRFLGLDSEDLMAQKLRGTMRGIGGAGSDDDASETSSICSESVGGAYRGRTSEDVSEILANLSSSQWAERKEGLRQLNHFVVNIRCLNRMELRRVTEVFTRMFFEPHAKVLGVFMDVLAELVLIHKHDLHDWLAMLLMRLLTKCGAEMLTSIASKVQHALDTIRGAFSNEEQFNVLARFIIDQTQTPNLKVKLQILNYLHALILQMDSSEFVNNGDTRLATSRIVTWAREPKSPDIRKASQAVLIGLFTLNTPEFSAMLQGLPKTFQEEATKVLQNHMHGTGDAVDVSSPKNLLSGSRSGSVGGRTTPVGGRTTPVGGRTTPVGGRTTPVGKSSRSRQPSVNQEDIYHSIRQTTADIQNLSLKSNRLDDGTKVSSGGGKDGQRDSTSQDSGIQSSLPDVRPPTEGDGRRAYNPSVYADQGAYGLKAQNTGSAGFADGDREDEMLFDPNDKLSLILVELSNHDQRQKEREHAMLTLIVMARDGTLGQWDEHFKTLLLLLLETLGDESAHIRALALRVLQVIIEHHKNHFESYAELTILKILEAHKDPDKDVLRAAEICAHSLALSIGPEHCLRVLCQITQQAAFPVNLAAIKMETLVIDNLSKESAKRHLSEILPGLLKGYDDSSSSVRKASVFALVALYHCIGEALRDHLGDLNGSKMKLLNLYISKAQSQKQEGKP